MCFFSQWKQSIPLTPVTVSLSSFLLSFISKYTIQRTLRRTPGSWPDDLPNITHVTASGILVPLASLFRFNRACDIKTNHTTALKSRGKFKAHTLVFSLVVVVVSTWSHLGKIRIKWPRKCAFSTARERWDPLNIGSVLSVNTTKKYTINELLEAR